MEFIEKEVLNPLGEVKNKKIELNPLPYDFDQVSLIDNTKPGTEIILKVLAETLGNREFLYIKKPAGTPTSEQKIIKASSSELAILALGDCGSCAVVSFRCYTT